MHPFIPVLRSRSKVIRPAAIVHVPWGCIKGRTDLIEHVNDDGMNDYVPAPQFFIVGAAMWSLDLFFALTLTCKRVLPACPVTSIAPLGPIGLCRVDYTYLVDESTYSGWMEVKAQQCPLAGGEGGVNHTVAVCYDTRNPSRHQASTDEDKLSPGAYTAFLTLSWFGFVMMVVSLMIAYVMFMDNFTRSRRESASPPIVQVNRHREVEAVPLLMRMAAEEEPPVPEQQPPQKLQRSDSAMA